MWGFDKVRESVDRTLKRGKGNEDGSDIILMGDEQHTWIEEGRDLSEKVERGYPGTLWEIWWDRLMSKDGTVYMSCGECFFWCVCRM